MQSACRAKPDLRRIADLVTTLRKSRQRQRAPLDDWHRDITSMARVELQWRLEMRSSVAVITAGLALGVLAMSSFQSRAQSPQDYRYCALDTEGGTDCYYNSRALCDAQGSGRCVENPGYVGDANARAQAFGGHHR
jgi:hypothetical protein